MLTWRGIPCRLSVLSSRCFSRHAPRRILTSSRTYYIPAFSPRPNTLSSKMWYRKDGTPRSKWKGAACTSILALVGSLAFGVYGMIYVVSELAEQNDSLSIFIRFLQSEDAISSPDLSTLDGSISCFREIFSGFDRIPKTFVDQYFVQFSEHLKSEECSAEKRQQAHDILREICERVRSALQESKDRAKPLEDIVVDVVDFVIERALELHQYLTMTGNEEEMAEIMHYLTKGRSELPDNYEEVGQ